jgi:hypothetical protein
MQTLDSNRQYFSVIQDVAELREGGLHSDIGHYELHLASEVEDGHNDAEEAERKEDRAAAGEAVHPGTDQSASF